MSELRTAWEALAAYEQADEDGVMVKVSRQAVDECLAAWNTRAPVRVKPLEWVERPHSLRAGGYEIRCNGSLTDPDAMWRVRLNHAVICKQIKGVDRAAEWAQRHHEACILSAIMGESE